MASSNEWQVECISLKWDKGPYTLSTFAEYHWLQMSFPIIKCNPNWSISQYKAHLVAKDFHQCLGLNYHDMFSVVIKPTMVHWVHLLLWHITGRLGDLISTISSCMASFLRMYTCSSPLGSLTPPIHLMFVNWRKLYTASNKLPRPGTMSSRASYCSIGLWILKVIPLCLSIVWWLLMFIFLCALMISLLQEVMCSSSHIF